jgi:mRNA interferase YafQ
MRNTKQTSSFKQDVKKLLKQTRRNMERLKTVMKLLQEEKPLGAEYKDHALAGQHKDERELHIEPDWLLIYKIKENDLIFVRTGTHSELFKK